MMELQNALLAYPGPCLILALRAFGFNKLALILVVKKKPVKVMDDVNQRKQKSQETIKQ